MADYFRELRSRQLGEVPHNIRMSRYLIDVGLFDENFGTGWPAWNRDPHPACPEAIKNLPTFVIQSVGKDCAICLMDYKKNDVVKCMPCQHIFHELCILTWLNQHNTCPFCRHSLPTGPN